MEMFGVESVAEFDNSYQPLAERMRPKKLEEVIGQKHLIGETSPLRRFFYSKKIPSIILWGPPGVGKTTLAFLFANSAEMVFEKISAIEVGVNKVREIITASKKRLSSGKKTLLFIDEIHRFNKSQQDALLWAVETGVITLIGATTENPSFEVNSALLSRCQIYKLKELDAGEARELVDRAISIDNVLNEYKFNDIDYDIIYKFSAGDARNTLNILELSFLLAKDDSTKEVVINRETVELAVQQKTSKYDKKGENHYDTISAFIKSLRGSDPDASLIWLAKMIDAGEDPIFICRRLVVFASEDIGNADPRALTLAVSCLQALQMIGMPEGRIVLGQTVTYLASAPKSNASYLAINEALDYVRNSPDLDVPLHLRNAPTKYMKSEGYGVDYKYPHNFDESFVNQDYFPQNSKPFKFYRPKESGMETKIKEKLNRIWKNR